jgi:hypothetical protein
MIVDRYLPEYDVGSAHRIDVYAEPHAIDAVLRDLNLGGSRLIRLLFAMRGLPRGSLGLEGMTHAGFRVLEHAPAEELVLGLIGRFWRLRERPIRFEPADFIGFSMPGYAKAVWNFRIEPVASGRCRLRTVTRVSCTDPDSRRSFLRYWRVIRPFSGVVRMAALREIRNAAEAAAR